MKEYLSRHIKKNCFSGLTTTWITYQVSLWNNSEHCKIVPNFVEIYTECNTYVTCVSGTNNRPTYCRNIPFSSHYVTKQRHHYYKSDIEIMFKVCLVSYRNPWRNVHTTVINFIT